MAVDRLLHGPELLSSSLKPGRLRWAILVVGYVALYIFLDWVSSLDTLSKVGVTPWNPQPGLTLAFLLILNFRYLPLVFLAAFLSDFLTHRGVDFFSPMIEALIHTIAYGATAWLLKKTFRFDPHLRKVADLLLLLGVMAFTTPVAAVLTVFPSIYFGEMEIGIAQDAILHHMLGDYIGVVVITPLLLRLYAGMLKFRLSGEVIAQAIGIGVVLEIVFALDVTEEARLFYLLFLPLIWIVLRHGLNGAALGGAAIQIGVIAASVIDEGDVATLVELQVLLLTVAVTGLFTGAVVDERREAEAQRRQLHGHLAHLARLSMGGEIASGLAHELNQPLAAFANYMRAASTLLERGESGIAEAQEALSKAEQLSIRAGEILRRLRDFLRRGEVSLRPINLSVVVKDAVELAAPAIRGRRISIEVADGIGNFTVMADRIQLTQVLLNLIVNGVESIEHAGHVTGRVSIAAREEDGEMVRIFVADTGPGIPQDNAERIFQSFFTTKPEGMGLGLSISQTLIEAHGGRIWYDSGAFQLTVPMATEANG